jgi:hypothetical protein
MDKLNGLRYKLHETADEMVDTLPDPCSWRLTMLYLVELLDSKTDDQMAFESMLTQLREDLSIRLEGGHW